MCACLYVWCGGDRRKREGKIVGGRGVGGFLFVVLVYLYFFKFLILFGEKEKC